MLSQSTTVIRGEAAMATAQQSCSSHGYSKFGFEWAPLLLPLERRLQTAAAFFWINTFVVMGLVTPFFLLYVLLFTSYFYLPLLYIPWLIWDWKTPQRGGRRIQWVREWKLWKYMAAYFPMKLIKTAPLDPDQNYIVGCHPHGILCASHFTNFSTEGTLFSKVFPGITPYLLPLNQLFCFPFFREFIMCGGMCSVSKNSISHLLERGKGQALFIVVGGAAESLDARAGSNTLILKNRKGFIKIALKHGASLVPVYSFGENSLYDQVDNPRGSTVRWIQESLRRTFGLAPAMFKGRGVFQYSFGIVPFRRKIVTVVGSPIAVPKVEKPTEEQINEYHSKYMTQLENLYEKHQPLYAEDVKSKLRFI